jgi:hypothetical protein
MNGTTVFNCTPQHFIFGSQTHLQEPVSSISHVLHVGCCSHCVLCCVVSCVPQLVSGVAGVGVSDEVTGASGVGEVSV